MSDDTTIAPTSWSRLVVAAALLTAVFSLSSCEEAFTGPSIVRMSIDPTSIVETDRGMSDEFFRVEIRTSGFVSDIQGVEIFIQDPIDRQAPFDHSVYPVIEGDTLTVEQIKKSWFQGVPPGTYDIGATVTSADAEITQRDLAEVTVTEASNGGS